MRSHLLLVSCIALGGCGDSAGDQGSTVHIRGIGPLQGLKTHDGPPPSPTSTGFEPVVTDMYIEETSSDTYSFVILVDSGIPIDVVYFVSEGQTYVADIPRPWTVRDWCDSVGHCSEACLNACSCARCDNDDQATAIISGCALNCTIIVESDLEYGFASEQEYVAQLYAALSQSDSSSGCSFDACEEAAKRQKAIYFPFPASLYDPLPALTTGDQGPLIAVAGPGPGGGRAVSHGLAPGVGPIRWGPCNPGAQCSN